MTQETKKLIGRGLFAGAMIGVGCMVYLACENKLLGAFLFSAGLFFVLTYGGVLFTGVCGLKTPWKRLAAVFGLNFAGIFAVSLLVWPGTLPASAAAVVVKKLGMNPLSWLCNGMLCGAMMYLGVTGFKQARDGVTGLASVLYAVPVFILAYFEHSIADMGYLAIALPCLSAAQALQMAGVILVVAAGNVAGSKLVRVLTTMGENTQNHQK